jgi:hypothetical protein
MFLLCYARRKRPCGCRSTDKRDELPSPHASPPTKLYYVLDSPSPSRQYEPSEPHHSAFCCSVVDNNWTPREPAMPVRSLRWTTRRHFLTTTGLTISPAPPSVPAATTMPGNASGDHRCDQHHEDGRVHAASMYAASMYAASMYAASMCDTPQARQSKT